MCIADRSLSRLRGSPLPGAGCLGPGARVGGIILPDADAGALSFAWVRISGWVLLRRLRRRCAFGLAVPLGLGLGAWPLTCVGALILPGAAAAASPPVRVWVAAPLGLGLGARPLTCVGAFAQPGAAAAALAAGALWGRLCRLGLGWVLGRVDVLRIRWTLPLFFPLQTIAPSQRGLPAPAGWGRGSTRTHPSGFADTWPVGKLRICLRCAA